jgi:hypothetical protein
MVAGAGLRMFRQDFRVPHVRHIPIFIGSRVIKEGTWYFFFCGNAEKRSLSTLRKVPEAE